MAATMFNASVMFHQGDVKVQVSNDGHSVWMTQDICVVQPAGVENLGSHGSIQAFLPNDPEELLKLRDKLNVGINKVYAVKTKRFAPGTRVRIRKELDRYPLNNFQPGLDGTVVADDGEMLRVRLDKHRSDLVEWDNELHWDEHYYGDRLEDLEVIA